MTVMAGLPTVLSAQKQADDNIGSRLMTIIDRKGTEISGEVLYL